jgi:hypothetical protein
MPFFQNQHNFLKPCTYFSKNQEDTACFIAFLCCIRRRRPSWKMAIDHSSWIFGLSIRFRVFVPNSVGKVWYPLVLYVSLDLQDGGGGNLNKWPLTPLLRLCFKFLYQTSSNQGLFPNARLSHGATTGCRPTHLEGNRLHSQVTNSCWWNVKRSLAFHVLGMIWTTTTLFPMHRNLSCWQAVNQATNHTAFNFSIYPQPSTGLTVVNHLISDTTLYENTFNYTFLHLPSLRNPRCSGVHLWFTSHDSLRV